MPGTRFAEKWPLCAVRSSQALHKGLDLSLTNISSTIADGARPALGDRQAALPLSLPGGQ